MFRPLSFALTGVSLSLIAAACSGDKAPDRASTSGAVDGDGTLVVKMLDNYFVPDTITVSAGAKVTFELPNEGKLPHNMHIASVRGVYRESPWLSKPALSNPGDTGRLTWDVPDEAGVYKFRCDIHESDMFGTITVQEG